MSESPSSDSNFCSGRCSKKRLSQAGAVFTALALVLGFWQDLKGFGNDIRQTSTMLPSSTPASEQSHPRWAELRQAYIQQASVTDTYRWQFAESVNDQVFIT